MFDEFKTKSAIIGKKGKMDDNEDFPIFVNLFDVNDPHKDPNTVPKRFLEFKVHKIIIKNLEVEYLLVGKDMVINNLKKIKLSVEGHGHLVVSGEQTSSEE